MTIAHPVVAHLFSFHLIGPLTVTGFGIAVLCAFFMAQFVCEQELTRRGQIEEAKAMGDVTFGALLGTLVGGKLYYVGVITHDIHTLFSRSGFVYWGGFMGSVLCCWLVIRWRKLSFLRFADVAGIAIAAGYAIGRTGCWAVGDDYGKAWNGALAVAFPEGSPPSTVGNMIREFGQQIPGAIDPSVVVTVIPTQLVEVVLGTVMFLIAWRFRKHRHAMGWLFGLYCVLAGTERFIVEFMRAKDDRFGLPFGLSTAQAIAIAVFIVGLIIMRARRNPAASPI